jgi:hypothetical protein
VIAISSTTIQSSRRMMKVSIGGRGLSVPRPRPRRR